jgi:hypothetical protein
MSYEIHSVDFRHNYTAAQARKWLKKHNYKPIKRVHITKKDGSIVSIRYRIQDPKLFKSFITKKIDDGNINLILGIKGEQDGAGIVDNVKQFIAGPRPSDMYPPKIRAFIEAHKDAQIENVMVARQPVAMLLQKLVNALSKGDLEQKMKQYNIDKLRHLYVVLRVDGREYTFEKNEVIDVAPFAVRSGAETMQLGAPSTPTTISELFSKLIIQDPSINIYDSIKANCQGFVAHVLRVLGLWGSDATINFVKQPTDKLLSPFVQKINKGITDTAARFNVLTEGYGRFKKY